MPENKQIKIKPIMAVLCDDVRQEASGKQTVIGMYVGGITVEIPESERDGVRPHGIVVNLWMPFQIPEAGLATIEVKVIGPDPSIELSFSAEMLFEEAPPDHEQSSVTFQKLPIKVDKEGDLKILFKNAGDSEWQTLKNIPVKINSPNQATIPAAKIVSCKSVDNEGK
jgi:hypothetical protein